MSCFQNTHKERYKKPEISIELMFCEDIMNGSDVDIDISELFEENK